jgi:hypothetical protein
MNMVALFPLLLLVVLVGGVGIAALVMSLLTGRRILRAALPIALVLSIVALMLGWYASLHRGRAFVHIGPPGYTLHSDRMESHWHRAIAEATERERRAIEWSQGSAALHPPMEVGTLPSPLARSAYAAGSEGPSRELPPGPPEAMPALTLPPVSAPPTAEATQAANPASGSEAAVVEASPTTLSEAPATEVEPSSAPAEVETTDVSERPSAAATDAIPLVETDQHESQDGSAEPASEVVEVAEEAATQAAVAASQNAAENDEELASPSAASDASATATATAEQVPAESTTAVAPAATDRSMESAPVPDVTETVEATPRSGFGESTTPPTAPAWVHQSPDQVDGHWADVLVSDPFDDRFACDDDLDRRTRAAIVEYARRRCMRLGLPTHLPLRFSYDELDMVVRERHYQPRTTSLGEMVQGYQLTVIDDTFETILDRQIADAMVADRLTATGAVSGVVLAGVSLLYSVFRFAARKAPDPLSVG